MRLAQITGFNLSGKGFWHHVLPDKNVCVMVGKRMLVTAPGRDDYFIHEDGTVEMAKVYQALHSDDGA
jgi:hypothetical protein